MARTAVMFESPHRFEESTADIVEVYGGDHAVVMVREATKAHETVWGGEMRLVASRVNDNMQGMAGNGLRAA